MKQLNYRDMFHIILRFYSLAPYRQVQLVTDTKQISIVYGGKIAWIQKETLMWSTDDRLFSRNKLYLSNSLCLKPWPDGLASRRKSTQVNASRRKSTQVDASQRKFAKPVAKRIRKSARKFTQVAKAG